MPAWCWPNSVDVINQTFWSSSYILCFITLCPFHSLMPDLNCQHFEIDIMKCILQKEKCVIWFKKRSPQVQVMAWCLTGNRPFLVPVMAWIIAGYTPISLSVSNIYVCLCICKYMYIYVYVCMCIYVCIWSMNHYHPIRLWWNSIILPDHQWMKYFFFLQDGERIPLICHQSFM